jgi:glyoxylase I family protein
MALEIEGCVTLLEVFDMRRSVAFYRDVLGFEVVAQSEPGEDFDWGALRRGAVELMLNTAYERHERPAAPDPARVRAHFDTALFFGCRDLDAAHAHLRAHGLNPRPPAVTSYGMRQLWLDDPDGYRLCFQWRAG